MPGHRSTRRAGIKLTRKTKKGNISVDDEVLTSIGIPLTEAMIQAKTVAYVVRRTSRL